MSERRSTVTVLALAVSLAGVLSCTGAEATVTLAAKVGLGEPAGTIPAAGVMVMLKLVEPPLARLPTAQSSAAPVCTHPVNEGLLMVVLGRVVLWKVKPFGMLKET